MNIQEKVIALLAEHLEIDPSEITAQTTFEDLDVDSLDTVEILMDMEDEFGVEIKFEEAGKSVADLAAYLEAHKE